MIDAGQFRRFDTKAPDGVVIAFKQVRTADQYPDLTLLADADEDRRAAYERDDWYFLGVQARAIVTIVTSGAGITYTLESAGLWGIESDSDEAYFDEVFEAEKQDLQDDLRRLATAILEQLPAPAAPAVPSTEGSHGNS